jgi:hypothetical protein
MARSVITEEQVRDEDFLSEEEFLSLTQIVWTTVSGSYSALVDDNLFLNSTVSGILISLPTSPSYGDSISFVDATGNCNVNNVTVSGSGTKIMGLAENFLIDRNNARFTLSYFNPVYGWVLGVVGHV